MSELITAGSTDQTIDIFLQDSSSATGAGLTGLAFNSSGLTCYYRKGATGAATQLTLATQTVGGAHTDGGFVEIDSTNAPGVYRLDLSDTMIAAEGFVSVYLHGATNLLQTALRINCQTLAADVVKVSGDSTAADNLELDYDGTGYNKSNSTIGTTTTNTDMVAAAPTAASVADAVWDEALSGHNLAGSTGKAIRQVKEGTITIEASIDDADATTTSFVTNLTESTTSYYSNKIMVFISGSLSGQARIITNYNGTNKAITLEEALTSEPADGDQFLILATHENSIGEIQAGLATSASIAALNDLSSADVTAAVPTAAQIRTEIDSNSTQLALLVDGQGYQLTILAGAISNAGTETETYTYTYNATNYAATYAGLDSSGNRGTTVLSKP